MSRKTVYGTTFKDTNFVPLHSATFCIECELISTNSRTYRRNRPLQNHADCHRPFNIGMDETAFLGP